MRALARALTCLSIGTLAGCLVSPEDTGLGGVSRRDSAALPDAGVAAGEARYEYVGLDASGAAVVTGVLVIEFSGDAGEYRISGSWDLEGPADPNLGPQIGQGTLAGTLDGGIVSIDLNPFWNDNNVYLHGRFDDAAGHVFRGTWNYSTFVGVVNEGRFSARKER